MSTELKTTWDLSMLFTSDDDPKMEVELINIKNETDTFTQKWLARNDYLEDPIILKEALDEYEDWSKNYGNSNTAYYLSMRLAQEQDNPTLKAKETKLGDFLTKIANQMQFFEINISKISSEKQQVFLESEVLNSYHHYLEQLFVHAPHILSDAEEKIMNYKQKTSYSNWVNMLSEFLSEEELLLKNEDGKNVVRPFHEVLSFVNAKNIKVRKGAAQVLENIFEKHLKVAEHEINTVCENRKVNDEIRKYARPDSSRHLSDDLHQEVVDTLVRAVSDKFDYSIDYYNFKSRLMKRTNLKYYERNIEYGELEKKYRYDSACELIAGTLSSLDEEFGAIFNEFLTQGRIDAFPKKGKAGGAFCAHGGLLQPTYILLNHTNQLTDVLTIAHEVGHGINNEFIRKKQHELNFGTPTSTAEVASTFMEDFVIENMVEEASGEEKLSLLMMKLDRDASSIFRQIAFYNFEWELHLSYRERGYLIAKEIGAMFGKHMKSYLGKSAEGADNWWIYVDHFRMYFYVYSYASGLLISKFFQQKVREDKNFIYKVKDFLSVGMSLSPQETFIQMGLDISKGDFWVVGLDFFADQLNQAKNLAKKLGKI